MALQEMNYGRYWNKIYQKSPSSSSWEEKIFLEIQSPIMKDWKEFYLKTYMHRLRNWHIKTELIEIKKLKGHTEHLKEGEARDSNGWTNDIFTENIDVDAFKQNENIPEFIMKADVTTIYKGNAFNIVKTPTLTLTSTQHNG